MSVQSMAIAVLLVSFLVMILLRFPIAYAVALSSLLCLLSQGLPLTTICQQMVKGISSFSLMAVPFFITMGVLMGTGGISEKLIALANACVGWMTGSVRNYITSCAIDITCYEYMQIYGRNICCICGSV